MEANYVALINEYVQKNHCDVRYEEVGAEGPAHLKTFIQRVILDGTVYPEGVGKNKKEAKHNAAKHALSSLQMKHTTSSDPTVSSEAQATPGFQPRGSQPNYISWLNEQSQRTGIIFRAEESVRMGLGNATQLCRFVAGDKKYLWACEKTRKEAKEKAAELVHQETFSSQTTGALDNNCNVSTLSLQNNQPDQSFSKASCAPTNFIGIVNHYCQKTGRIPDFRQVKHCGPPNCPRFFYNLVINGREYPEGEGKTVKEAKQNAAKLAWSALQEQSDWNSQVSLKSNVSDEEATSDLATSTSELGSRSTASQGTATCTDSKVFTNSSTPSKQMSPAVKPKIKLAPTFPKAADNSKEIGQIPDLKNADLRNASPRTATSSTEIDWFLSNYDNIERLGKGGFGRVYKARLKHMDQYYAVKIVKRKEKAIREAQALSKLEHPNIIRYFTSWISNSDYRDDTTDSFSSSQSSSDNTTQFLYIQMQLCDMNTLQVWIDERNVLRQDARRSEDALLITLKIMRGVKYIHSKKLIHRDLKPSNIMFRADGELKIVDFGLVTDMDNESDESRLERTKRVGTKSYMAPEQRNGVTYDRKVDIFAVGLIFFELIWKMSGHEKAKVWSDIRSQKCPEGLSAKFPQEHDKIITMLNKKPEDRPDASDMLTKLECSLPPL